MLVFCLRLQNKHTHTRARARAHTHTRTHTLFQWLRERNERERVILYSKHQRSASDNGCISCLSFWSEAAVQYFSPIALCFNEWMKMLTFGFHFCNFDLKMWNFTFIKIRSKTQVSLYTLVKAKQNQRHIQFYLYVPTDQCTNIRPKRLDSWTFPK